MTLPLAPTEVPLIIRRPPDAMERLVEAVAKFLEHSQQIADAVKDGRYEDARDLIRETDQVASRPLIRATQVAERPDLDVDQLVLDLIPTDGTWVHIGSIHRVLGALDARLTEDAYQSPQFSYMRVSPVDVVVWRLTGDGTLRKHGGSHQVRRTTKS